MRRGDIVRVDLPHPAGSPGREQFGYRPAVVIQDASQIGSFSTAIVVPITGTRDAVRFPGAFAISPTATNGLDRQSVVLTNQVRAIDIRRIESTIGTMSKTDMDTLDARLRTILGL